MLKRTILLSLIFLSNLFSNDRVDLSHIDNASYNEAIINNIIVKSNNKCNMLNDRFGCDLKKTEIVELFKNIKNEDIELLTEKQLKKENIEDLTFKNSNGNLTIKIKSFYINTAKKIEEELKKEPKSVTIDLKDSEGGSLMEIMLTIGLFVDKEKELFKKKDRHDIITAKPIESKNNIFYKGKIKILTNKNTVNGSALFVYCLKGNKNVVLENKEIGNDVKNIYQSIPLFNKPRGIEIVNDINSYSSEFNHTLFVLKIKNSEFLNLDEKPIKMF